MAIVILVGCGIVNSGLVIAASDKFEEFSADELREFLSDKTYPMGGKTLKKSKGAFYFHADGSLDAIWKKKKEQTKWTVESGSKFCYNLKMFGGKECIQLLKNNKEGGYVHIFDGKKRMLAEDAIVIGKQFIIQ